MSFDQLFLDELAVALRSVKLEAVVVGNAASILHGAPVLTQDVDLLVRDTPRNRVKLTKLVDKLHGTGPVDISELIGGKRIFLPEIYLDILFNKMGGGISFNAAKTRSSQISVGENSLTVASLEDVIRSKEAVNRPKDRAALPILRSTLAVQKLKK
jgi:hypothetical protein